ncbi:MAG: uracil-DNA glycosylase [Aquificae bacterium]|nr:uracil-DNA glycosylase [Aquificota bacterium]
MDELRDYLNILKSLGFNEIFIDKEEKSVEIQEKVKLLEQIAQQIKNCTKCDLHKSRTNPVPGEGNPDAKLMFVGEAPGGDEDKQGRPFVGRAGKLLTKMIEATGHKREEFFITNTVKCRPPKNRTPTPWEQEACWEYLEKQIEIVDPKVICLLGAAAGYAFLKRPVKITKERGQIIKWNGRILYLTYHPAYILRNLQAEPILLQDIKRAIELAYSQEEV